MIIKGANIIPSETSLDFIGKRFFAYGLSAVIILASVLLIATKGLNFGIDFTGGTLIEIRLDQEPDISEIRKDLNGLGIGSVLIQEFGQPSDFLIRIPQQDPGSEKDRSETQQAAIDKVRQSLNAAYGEDTVTHRRVEYVGPQVGEELKTAGLISMISALIGIMIYVSFRFEWQFGVASLTALAHDVIATLGLFAITQMEFNLSTVAALLMIAGYSINDTVVVFDRIRENLRKFKKLPFADIFNRSINQSLSRTIITSVTTLIVLLALWIFGGEVIQGFINALIFGIIIGTYSSIFVASPILMLMNIKTGKTTESGEDETGVQDNA